MLVPFVGAQPVLAAPASVITSEAIAAKQAEEDKAKRELELMRDELASRVTEYVRVGKLIEGTRRDISVVATRLVETDAELLRTEQAVLERAVELYRGDRVGLFSLLFDARTIQDLMVRYNYMTIINRRDTDLMESMRVMRAESAYLHESLRTREAYLVQLQGRLDVQREEIVAGIDAQQQKATSLGVDIAEMIRQAQLMKVANGSAPKGPYDPDTLISDANYRDSTSMSVDQIQAFLESQTGALDSYIGPDHSGVPKSAARMISEAAIAWGVSPKVILAVLQKEQSLLTRQAPSASKLDWAMGCGKADSRTFYQYQGFGNQIWGGAQKLSQNAAGWRPGIMMTIDGNSVYPSNASTYSLYKYTPHLPGTMSFWLIYWRYFGDPLGQPTIAGPAADPNAAQVD
jgi:hypothetical protein